jgi:hypothetical protein
VTRPSAADQLAEFFAGAARIDGKLRNAATLINGGVRQDVIVLAPATVAAVRGIQPHQLVGTIPGGMDRELLRSVMLVYSDLVSRRLAMDRAAAFAPSATLPRTGSEAKDLITCHARRSRWSAPPDEKQLRVRPHAPSMSPTASKMLLGPNYARSPRTWMMRSGGPRSLVRIRTSTNGCPQSAKSHRFAYTSPARSHS